MRDKKDLPPLKDIGDFLGKLEKATTAQTSLAIIAKILQQIPGKQVPVKKTIL